MRSRAPSHTIALILASTAAVAACGGEEAFEPQLATNQRLLAAVATAQLSKDDQSIEQMTVVGDLDGDDIEDAVIRTTYAIHPAGDLQFGGDIYVIYGGGELSGSIDLASLPRLTGAYGFGVGTTAARVGDVDGDGLADVLVTASRSLRCAGNVDGTGDDLRTGAYLVYGNRARLTGAVAIQDVASFLRDTHPCSIVSTVAGLGDLDGDGSADFAIARLGIRADEPTETFVYYGGARLPTLVDMVASADAVIADEPAATGIGPGIASVGDVDGDGYADFVVRDPIPLDTNVRLIRGSATRLAGNVLSEALSRTLFLGEDRCFDNEHFAAPLGDLDADGTDDFALVGCRGTDQRLTQAAFDRIFYGRRAGFPAQVRFDEADATLRLTDGARGHLAGGDVDGDGLPDLVVGDSGLDDGNGGVHVVKGTGARLSGNIDPGTRGLTYVGGPRRGTRCEYVMQPGCVAHERVGFDLSLGDLTGDRQLDIFVEAPTNQGSSSAIDVHGSAMDRAYLLIP